MGVSVYLQVKLTIDAPPLLHVVEIRLTRVWKPVLGLQACTRKWPLLLWLPHVRRDNYGSHMLDLVSLPGVAWSTSATCLACCVYRTYYSLPNFTAEHDCHTCVQPDCRQWVNGTAATFQWERWHDCHMLCHVLVVCLSVCTCVGVYVCVCVCVCVCVA